MKEKNPKIIFFGTPEFAATILEKILASDIEVVAVFTQPDKRVGRGQDIVSSPVKELAVRKGIKLYQPEKFSDEIAEEMKNIGPEAIVVAAYGKILPKNILEIPKYGAINVHASLLPKYRGASPIQGALLSGEQATGVTLMLMDEGLDTGAIIASEKAPINDKENLQTLTAKLAEIGGKLLTITIPKWVEGRIETEPQNEAQSSYSPQIRKKDGEIDWKLAATEIDRKARALAEWPGIYTFYKKNGNKARLKILEIEIDPGYPKSTSKGKVFQTNGKIAVQAGSGIVILKKIQPEGKKAMQMEEFVQGNNSFLNTILG